MSNSEALDFRAASEFFSEVSRPLNDAKRVTPGLVVNRGGKNIPTDGPSIFSGRIGAPYSPTRSFAAPVFKGPGLRGQMEIDEYLPGAIETAVSFIEPHTRQSSEIERIRRTDLPGQGAGRKRRRAM